MSDHLDYFVDFVSPIVWKFGVLKSFFWWHCALFCLVDVKWDFDGKLEARMTPTHESKFWTFFFLSFSSCNLETSSGFLFLLWSSLSLPVLSWICVSIDNSVFNIFSIWDFLSDLSLLNFFFLFKNKEFLLLT